MSNHTGNYLTRSATRLIDHTLNKRREEEQALRMRNAIAGMKGGGEEALYNALGNARTPGEANAFINLNKMNRGLAAEDRAIAAEDRAIKRQAWQDFYESGDTDFLAKVGIEVTPELTKRGDARREYLDNKWSAENASNEEKIAAHNLNNQVADPATVKELGLSPQHLDGSPWKWGEVKNIRKFKAESGEKTRSPRIPYVLEKNGRRYRWNPETEAHDIDLGPIAPSTDEPPTRKETEDLIGKIKRNNVAYQTLKAKQKAFYKAWQFAYTDQEKQRWENELKQVNKDMEALDEQIRANVAGGGNPPPATIKHENPEGTSEYNYHPDTRRIVRTK